MLMLHHCRTNSAFAVPSRPCALVWAELMTWPNVSGPTLTPVAVAVATVSWPSFVRAEVIELVTCPTATVGSPGPVTEKAAVLELASPTACVASQLVCDERSERHRGDDEEAQRLSRRPPCARRRAKCRAAGYLQTCCRG